MNTNTHPQRPAVPSGYGDYSNEKTREMQRNIDREFDRREYEYLESVKSRGDQN